MKKNEGADTQVNVCAKSGILASGDKTKKPRKTGAFLVLQRQIANKIFAKLRVVLLTSVTIVVFQSTP